jgi:hypothetical protein
MRRFVVLLCLAVFLAPGPGSTQEFTKGRRADLQAPLAKWPEARTAYGYAGPEGEFYALEANSITWMSPGSLIPISVPPGDFVLRISFQVVYGEDWSLNITLSDSGTDYSQVDLFLTIKKSGLARFSINENAVQNNFYVSNSKKIAEGLALGQSFSGVDWGRPNTLTIERKGNEGRFGLNDQPAYSFSMPAFHVKQLGVGVAGKSKVLLRSVAARVP